MEWTRHSFVNTIYKAWISVNWLDNLGKWRNLQWSSKRPSQLNVLAFLWAWKPTLSHCVLFQFSSTARNNYGRAHQLFTSVAPGLECLNWHPNVTVCRTTAASIWLPLYKSLVYSLLDKKEHTTLALVIKKGTVFSRFLVTIAPLTQASVGDALEPVFMAESEFQVASKRQNLLQRRHWFWTSTWTAP